MQDLADFMLRIGNETLPVSAPQRGDMSRSSSFHRGGGRSLVTLGFAATDADRAQRLAGQEARLLTNITSPGLEAGRLRVLKVDRDRALLVGEVVRR